MKEEVKDELRTSYTEGTIILQRYSDSNKCNNDSSREPSTRFTKAQQQMLLDFAESNPGILIPKDVSAYKRNNAWYELTILLNSCRNGPQKTLKKWQKCLKNWKCLARAKQNKLLQKTRDHSGSRRLISYLTPLDLRLLTMLGENTLVHGANMNDSLQAIGVDECSNQSGSVNINGEESSDEVADVKASVPALTSDSSNACRGSQTSSKHQDNNMSNAFLMVKETSFGKIEGTLGRIEAIMGKIYELEMIKEERARRKEERKREAHEWRRELFEIKREKYALIN